MPGQRRYRSRHGDGIADTVMLDCLGFAGAAFLSKPVDTAISDVLACLGEKMLADRCWMIEYDTERARFRNSHEWCAHGISSHVEDLQDAPVSLIGWLHRSLLDGKAVMIDDVNDLPQSARALRREMLRQGDRSVLSVPIFHAGKLRALFGFDQVRAQRTWTDREAALLFACARMLAEARYGGPGARLLVSSRERNAPLVYIGRGGSIRGIPFSAISGIRSQRDDTCVWLNDGSCILDQRTLAAWRALLPQARFPTIHRTAIVNLIHIAGLDKHGGAGFQWQVHMRGIDQDWPVSRPYRNNLVERLGL